MSQVFYISKLTRKVLNNIMQRIYVAMSFCEVFQNPIFNSHMHSFNF